MRASLLFSVGKIFHCVHYLSAAPRITQLDVRDRKMFLISCKKRTNSVVIPVDVPEFIYVNIDGASVLV